MFGVGCCLGAGPAAVAVFPAAISGLVFGVGRFLTKQLHELPFGPHLAIASFALIFGWNHIADYVRPSLPGIEFLLGPLAPLLGL
jgi:prepilin signal peptidase PulO-like enzyme (type II secretory pathway)